MIRVETIAVGSVPLALVDDFRAGRLTISSTPTRLQITAPAQGLDMFDELRKLADGTAVSSAEPDPTAVVKAQLPGPVTLIVAEVETLQTCIRRLRSALDTLLTIHPLLEEVWLDEGLLAAAPNDWSQLLARTLRALKAEYHHLRFGVHCCGHLRSWELDEVDADAWAFDLSLAADDAIQAKRDGRLRGTLVWSIIPTNGDTPAWSADEILTLHDELQPNDRLIISAGCGFGTRDRDTIERAIAHQDHLIDALRSRIATRD